MFVLWRRTFLEKTRSVARGFIVCNCLLLMAQAAHGGVYQHTKDGKTLVWNNYPSENDVVSWSGKTDASGYATGKGTLTWYRTDKAFVTGSHLPGQGPAVVESRYSGKMVRGKFNGTGVNIDADGKKFQLTFVDGVKRREQPPEPTPGPEHHRDEHRSGITQASPPAEGPAPSPIVKEPSAKSAFRGMIAEGLRESRPFVPKPTPSPSAETPMVQVASIRSPLSSSPPVAAEPPPPPPQQSAPSPQSFASPQSAPPTQSPPTSDGMDSAVRDRIIADFRDETQTVLSQVGEATGNFRGVDQLESIPKLPITVSESVGSLAQRARHFRSKVGYEIALRDYKTETETVDALSTVDQVTRSIASNDAAEASSKLTDFLKNNPEPGADNEKPLWQYLASMRQLCGRLEREADIHSQRAQSLGAACRTSEAIREYQEAYRMFPNPATAEKIRQLQANSLGL